MDNVQSTDWHGRLETCWTERGNYKKIVNVHKLNEIARDFNASAQLYAKVIISERCLPDERKSIKPAGLGGVAGGKKFIAGGIIFKYAEDVLLPNNSWLYGGDAPSDVVRLCV